MYGIGDGVRREREQRGLNIFGARGVQRIAEDLLQPCRVEQVAAGALGRQRREERFSLQARKEHLVDVSAAGPGAVGVVAGIAVHVNPIVHQRVARAAVEAKYGVARVGGLRRQDREVGDAANVADRSPRIGQAEQRAMQCRNEGGALAAGGDVATAKIGNDIDAGALGQHRRVLRLARVADAIVGAGLMTDGLPVRADGPHVLRGQAGCGKQSGNAVGVGHGQRIGGQRLTMDLVVAGVLQVQEALAQLGREGHVRVGEDGRGFAGKVRQYAIDAIQAGARHEADVAIGRECGVVRMAHARQLTSAMAGQMDTSR